MAKISASLTISTIIGTLAAVTARLTLSMLETPEILPTMEEGDLENAIVYFYVLLYARGIINSTIALLVVALIASTVI